MEVFFKTKKLEGDLATDKGRTRAYGAEASKALAHRMIELAAADSLNVMRTLPGRCHELHGGRAGQLAVDVRGGLRLIFRPRENPPPAKPDGGLDWTAVTSIEILEVTDYHGD